MAIKVSLWWGPPKKFDERQNERKISWLELFFDLVYVAAIGQLTHRISTHPGWDSVLLSFLLFSLLFWSWINSSQYYDLHGSDGIRTRIMTFWQMLAVAAVAVNIPGVFEGDCIGFAVSAAIIQILITYLWWSVGLYDPSHRVFSVFFTTNYLIGFGLLIVSVFTPHDIAVYLWIAVLVLDITPPIIGGPSMVRILRERGQVFTASAAIIERFGLFTIIVLAESILATVTSISELPEKGTATWFALILAILISFLIWSIYFDMTSEQETKKGYWFMQLFILFHFPLLASLGVVGASMKYMLLHAEHNNLVQWFFCLAIAIVLLSVVGVTKVMEESEEERSFINPVNRIIFITTGAILIVPFFGNYLNTLQFFAIVAAILVGPVVIGTVSWVKFKFYN